MKKLIGLLFLLALCLSSFAQDKAVTFSNNETYFDFTFDAGDTISNNDTLYSIEININQHYKSCQNVYIDIDSVSGTPTMDISLQGRVFSTDTWTTIGSAVSWAGTGDTTFSIANATAKRYRLYRILFDANSTAQKAKIMDVKFKAWRE